MDPFYSGQRVRVIRTNNREGILGFTGTVQGIQAGRVRVRLDTDPGDSFRLSQRTGFEPRPPSRPVIRIFEFNQLEPA